MVQEVLQRRWDQKSSGQLSEVNTNWERHWSWSSYNYTRSCPRTRCQLFYGHSTFEANWKGEKLNKWVTRKLTKNQNIIGLKCCLLLFYTTMNHFSIGSWGTMKSGFHTTISDNQFRGWIEKKLQSTSKSQTCSKKKVMVTIWWSAASLIHYSFLNPSKTITSEKYAQQIDEMYQKWQRLQPALVNRKGPVLHNNAWTHFP